MGDKKLKSVDLNKLANKKFITVSSKEALKDVVPIEWSDEVLEGKKKVEIKEKR